MCSMEKKARDHGRQLAEKLVRKPFFDHAWSSQPRMDAEELAWALQFIDDHFFLIRSENDALPSVDWVLERAKSAVLRYGIRGLVIDPYNELDHRRPPGQTETEYVSQMLTKVKRFAQYYDVHVWFVAHPRQLRDWHGAAPTLYDISGSAHFINKADNGVIVHRNRDTQDPVKKREVSILIRKVRNKMAGTIGESVLVYDRATGTYRDPAPERLAELGHRAGDDKAAWDVPDTPGGSLGRLPGGGMAYPGQTADEIRGAS
ncbi:unnamed protein product [Pedinophyceae sp. YPF-701]|nr:unnamed protein product [Pedinophyceae sp. YPF-701]